MPLTKEQLALAKSEHKALYKIFRWRTDYQVFGKPEFWDRPVFNDGLLDGDCDDWAMEMDYRLREIPIEFRRLAICRISHRSKVQDHCVLIVVDPKGLWVSDCNSDQLTLIQSLPYDMWQWSPVGAPITANWEDIPGHS